MTTMVQFEKNLKEGQKVEEAVRDHIEKMLPDCKVFISKQDDDLERMIYSLVDVVVMKDSKVVLGIECKLSRKKYRYCLRHNGWDGDWNTPLNNTSLRKYREARFPFYVVNINEFCHKAYAADIPTILGSRFGKEIRKKSGVLIENIDSHTWMVYEGKFSLTDILTDILKKEKLC